MKSIYLDYIVSDFLSEKKKLFFLKGTLWETLQI